MVYVELPKIGAKVTKGGQAGVVESVKSASELFSPVTGEIVEINADLAKDLGPRQPGPASARPGSSRSKSRTTANCPALKDEKLLQCLLIKGL